MIKGATLLTLALATPAGAFELAWPLDCTLGETCYVQNYADHDPGPGNADFTCGPLTYDGHDGTDIGLPTVAAMEAGVQVRAAASGTVRATRDITPDFAPAVVNQECGNAVVIDHADGWTTQYCHMKHGSVVVHPGETVQTGTPLGLVGQSGAAEFPHLHLTVRHDDLKIDPFEPAGAVAATACSATLPTESLWATPVPYNPGGLLEAGFSASAPEYDAVLAGLPTVPLPATASALILWGLAYGTRSGDQIALSIAGPAGEIMSHTDPIDRTQARTFRYMGRRLHDTTWPAGTYTGTITLLRDGSALDTITTEVQITP